MRRLLAIGLAIIALPAFAQDATLDVDLSNPLQPVVTWSTTPAATGCTASWGGAVGPSGSAVVPAIRDSTVFGIACDVAGDSFAMLSWVNPTQNTDGSPYTDPQATRIVWSMDGVNDFDCLDPDASGDAWTDRPAGQTMHTLTGLAPGVWTFTTYAVNSLGLCSMASNAAQKTTTAGGTISASVSIAVPAPITGLGAT